MSRPAVSRTGARLMLHLVVLTALLAATLVWIALASTQRVFERRIEAELSRRVRAADGVARRLGARIGESLDRLERELTRSRPEILERLLRGGPEVVETAGKLMRRQGLDLLEVLDADGTILSSGLWSERVALPWPELLQVADGMAVWRVVAASGGERPALVSRRTVPIGQRTIHLVGGRFPDPGILEELGGGTAALLIDGDGRLVESSAAGRRIEPSDAARALIWQYS